MFRPLRSNAWLLHAILFKEGLSSRENTFVGPLRPSNRALQNSLCNFQLHGSKKTKHKQASKQTGLEGGRTDPTGLARAHGRNGAETEYVCDATVNTNLHTEREGVGMQRVERTTDADGGTAAAAAASDDAAPRRAVPRRSRSE